MQLGFVKVALFAWNGPTGQGRLLFMNSGWFYYLYGWVIFFLDYSTGVYWLGRLLWR